MTDRPTGQPSSLQPQGPAVPAVDPAGPSLTETSSSDLLLRAQAGDSQALDTLFARYLPSLRRWARGRLPTWARDIADTTDLVQDTLLQTCKRIELFDAGRDASLQAYLRQALLNRIRDEFRRRRRRPAHDVLEPTHADDGPSPFELAAGEELLEAYEAAMERLRPEERELIVARVQMQLSYEEVAETTGRANANAARSAVVRALGRLAEEMGRAT